MDLNLTENVFFIAGSTKGIGLGIAECFLREGARVVITGRNRERLNSAFSCLATRFDSNRILPIHGDMQDFEHMKNQLDNVQKVFGRLDGVIANIGSGAEPLGLPSTPNIWEISFDKNLKASLQLVQASFPFLKMGGGGTITFISSIAGIEDIKAPMAYSLHKAALVAASKKLSREFSPFNIRVNVIAPGNILFPGGTWEKKQEQNTQEVTDYIRSEVPLNTFGDPEDIGNICVFFSSEKAKFITGSTVVVDGGQTRCF
ncbi:MAG: SDR family oxidoreductase [Alphaproteobacteria bacterium]|nr:SDR family oxidoreductase [Alphaproteobacteria bacterium]